MFIKVRHHLLVPAHECIRKFPKEMGRAKTLLHLFAQTIEKIQRQKVLERLTQK